VLAALNERYEVEIEEIATRQETVTFKLPRAIAPRGASAKGHSIVATNA
jgi:hypothetical protein